MILAAAGMGRPRVSCSTVRSAAGVELDHGSRLRQASSSRSLSCSLSPMLDRVRMGTIRYCNTASGKGAV